VLSKILARTFDDFERDKMSGGFGAFDGSHPNEPGYDVVKHALERALETVYRDDVLGVVRILHPDMPDKTLCSGTIVSGLDGTMQLLTAQHCLYAGSRRRSEIRIRIFARGGAVFREENISSEVENDRARTARSWDACVQKQSHTTCSAVGEVDVSLLVLPDSMRYALPLKPWRLCPVSGLPLQENWALYGYGPAKPAESELDQLYIGIFRWTMPSSASSSHKTSFTPTWESLELTGGDSGGPAIAVSEPTGSLPPTVCHVITNLDNRMAQAESVIRAF
jgi:hypothetical protein